MMFQPMMKDGVVDPGDDGDWASKAKEHFNSIKSSQEKGFSLISRIHHDI